MTDLFSPILGAAGAPVITVELALVLAIGAAAAVLIAFLTPSLRGIWLLRPVSPENPVPPRESVNTPVLYRFATYGSIHKEKTDPTLDRPRWFLAILLFVLFGSLLQIAYVPAGDWTVMITAVGVMVLGASLYAAGWTNTLAIALLVCIPGGVAYYGWDADWRTLGIVGGGVVALLGGIMISMNYRSLVFRLRLEIRKNEGLDGDRLTGPKASYRRFQFILLLFLPLVLLYQMIAFWMPEIRIEQFMEQAGIEYASGAGVALLVASLALGLNLVVFAIPLFAETLQKASFHGAADFGRDVKKWQEAEGDEKIASAREEVDSFLTSGGRWAAFQRGTSFNLAMAAMYLVVSALGQVLAKVADLGADQGMVDLTAATWTGASTNDWAAALLGYRFIADAAIFMGGIVALISLKDGDKADADDSTAIEKSEVEASGEDPDAADVNVRSLWYAARHPDATFICEQSGGEPIIFVHHDEPGDPMPAGTDGAETPDAG